MLIKYTCWHVSTTIFIFFILKIQKNWNDWLVVFRMPIFLHSIVNWTATGKTYHSQFYLRWTHLAPAVVDDFTIYWHKLTRYVTTTIHSEGGRDRSTGTAQTTQCLLSITLLALLKINAKNKSPDRCEKENICDIFSSPNDFFYFLLIFFERQMRHDWMIQSLMLWLTETGVVKVAVCVCICVHTLLLTLIRYQKNPVIKQFFHFLYWLSFFYSAYLRLKLSF